VTPLSLAHVYLEAFFGQRPLSDMASVLAEGLVFVGPFYRFNSRQGYLDSLHADPPKGVSYTLLHEYEDENGCCVIYRFCKQDIETVMAQHFECLAGEISKIRLVFDSAAFKAD